MAAAAMTVEEAPKEMMPDKTAIKKEASTPAPAPPPAPTSYWGKLAHRARESEKEAEQLEWGVVQKGVWSTAASGFEAADQNEKDAPLFVGGAAFAAFIILGFTFSALKYGKTSPAVKSVPQVVQVATKSEPVPRDAQYKKIRAASEALIRDDEPEELYYGKKAPAPKPTPAPTPAPAVVKTAPAAISFFSAPTPAKASNAAPEKEASKELPLARSAVNITASGLRALADTLPGVERTLEGAVPSIEKKLQWTAGINESNVQEKVNEVLPIVGGVAARGAEATLKTGLEVGSLGLKIIGDNLPAAGTALKSAVDLAMPSVLGGARDAADNARNLAKQAAVLEPDALPSNIPLDIREKAAALARLSPFLLSGTGSAIDLLADVAPKAEEAVTYGAKAALPVLQAALGTAANVSSDLSKVEAKDLPALPDQAQLEGALKAVGVDPSKVAAGAQELASGVKSKFEKTP